MRLWSIHPKYLDSKGLVALWREGLLAQKVLLGNTRGYKNHPQLIRFQAMENPTNAISAYLYTVVDEALIRGYKFNASKIVENAGTEPMDVNEGQLQYELRHLLNKLEVRDPVRFHRLKNIMMPEANKFFHRRPGDIESWEILSNSPQAT